MSFQISRTVPWASPLEMLIQKVWGPEFYIPNKSTDHADAAGLWDIVKKYLYEEHSVSLVRTYYLVLIFCPSPTNTWSWMGYGPAGPYDQIQLFT